MINMPTIVSCSHFIRAGASGIKRRSTLDFWQTYDFEKYNDVCADELDITCVICFIVYINML